MLSDKKVQMQFNENNSNSWVSILVNASPFLLLIGFWIFMMRQMQSGGIRLSVSAKAAPGCIPPSSAK